MSYQRMPDLFNEFLRIYNTNSIKRMFQRKIQIQKSENFPIAV